jgi:hypothetical protein
VDGRDSRWVEIDAERADLVRLAFTLYASGEYSLVYLAELLTKKGLMSRPTKRLAARGMAKNTLANMLANPYYMGVTRYQGVEYPGKHEALVSPELFRRVQGVLKARLAGEKQRTHMHYFERHDLLWQMCLTAMRDLLQAAVLVLFLPGAIKAEWVQFAVYFG